METGTGSGPSALRHARAGAHAGAVAGTVAGMVFDGESASIAAARAFTAEFLAQAAAEFAVPVPPRAVDDAQLVVSELVTNAVKYASGPCAVRLGIGARALEITVWDTEPAAPVPRGPEPGRIGQHGLEVVVALCESFEVRRDRVGKHVTALIALAPACPPDRGAGRCTAAAPQENSVAPGKSAADPA